MRCILEVKPAMPAGRRKAAATKRAPRPKGQAKPKGAKQAAVIELMSRPEDATAKELIDATGWQAHTVRGAISGALKKKLGLKIESIREDGVTTYRIVGRPGLIDWQPDNAPAMASTLPPPIPPINFRLVSSKTGCSFLRDYGRRPGEGEGAGPHEA